MIRFPHVAALNGRVVPIDVRAASGVVLPITQALDGDYGVGNLRQPPPNAPRRGDRGATGKLVGGEVVTKLSASATLVEVEPQDLFHEGLGLTRLGVRGFPAFI